jgi:nicotinamide phosphoribosyltransferase
LDKLNVATFIDFYKADHRRQYPPKTESIYSNLTPRSSRVTGDTGIIFFGLQYALTKYLQDEFWAGFFYKPVDEVCARYERRMNTSLGPNNIGSEHIRALHALRHLPVEVRALPEGTFVPLRVPVFTIENTLPEFAWVVNYLETLLSSAIWQPCTSATTAWKYRKLLNKYAEETSDIPEFVQWQGHDFSFRGMPGPEAAAASGAGHLLSFTGTDTIPAIDLLEAYYGADAEKELIGGSVPATEHSVMCAGGKESELQTFERLLDLYPDGIVSVVSDTWDLWKVLTETLPALKDRIMARDGKLVIRPDSGDPVKIICGDPDALTLADPAYKGVVQLLWDVFGGTINSKGFKQLDPHVGVIYGDSITLERCEAICAGLKANGFASTNMVFGIGSFTYQYVTRDTYGFAMKATSAVIDGKEVDLFKKPVTDNGEKFSAKGRLAVFKKNGILTLIEGANELDEMASSLVPVWRDGKLLKHQTLAEIRARVASY